MARVDRGSSGKFHIPEERPRSKKEDAQHPLTDVFSKKVPTKSKNGASKRKISAKTAVTPEVYIGLDDAGKPKISLGREAPPIKKLVLQGGGAKGVVYPFFMKEVDQRLDLIKNLDEVSGTSAGACMAFLLAAGVAPKEIEEFSKNTDIFNELWGGKKGKATKDVKLGFGILPAIQLRETLIKITSKPALDYYQYSIKNSDEMIALIKEKPGGNAFLKKAELGFPKGLTFSDLEILHSLNPEKFKILHVTAYDRDKLEPVYFNAAKTGNVNCFEAVVASMSIPFVIRPVKLAVQNKESEHFFIDGGVYSNVPLETFARREDYKPEEVLVLHFDNHGKGYANLHGPKNPVEGFFTRVLTQVANAVVDVVARVFLGIKDYHLTKSRDAKKVYDLGFNAVVIPHGEIGGLDFRIKEGSSKWKKAVTQAKVIGERYAELTKRGHLVQRDYSTMTSAINSLSPEEVKALSEIADEKIERANEQMESEKNQMKLERLQAEIQFYQMVREMYLKE